MDGILIIDKPEGWTSFDVVAKVRALIRRNTPCPLPAGPKTKHRIKVGHLGTLDPMATGVLPVLMGSATKAANFVPNKDKEYIATVKFGVATDTLDITGEILAVKDVNFTKEELLTALTHFTGKIKQVPPMFSAIKKDGVPLYKLARKGIEVKREPRDVEIMELELTEFDGQTARLRILCSGGTYVRSLCRDLGEMLGCGATLAALQRTKACGFDIKNAIELKQVEQMFECGEIKNKVLPVEKLFEQLDSLNVTKEEAFKLTNGVSTSTQCDFNKEEKLYKIVHQGEFLGLVEFKTEEKIVKPIKFFGRPL